MDNIAFSVKISPSTVHQQEKDAYFTVNYTNGQGYCAFTPEQTGKAFDVLGSWVKTGVKAKAGFIE